MFVCVNAHLRKNGKMRLANVNSKVGGWVVGGGREMETCNPGGPEILEPAPPWAPKILYSPPPVSLKVLEGNPLQESPTGTP